jgi:hypothetical protein
MKKFLFLSFLTFLFIQCNDKKSEEAVDYAVEAATQKEFAVVEEAEPAPADASEESGTTQAPINPVDQKIIKTGYFTFETASVTETFNQIKESVEAQKGYIQNDQTQKSYNRITRTLTLRIPTTGFQPLIDTLSKRVEVFDEQRIDLEDVTEEFYDIEARTKAKKELEARYLQLLSKAGNIKDMLEIERQLASIREEIEAQEGRLKYLQNRVSYSTLHLTFYEITDVKHAPSQSYFSRLGNAVKGGFNGVGEFLLGIVALWPLWLIGGLIFFFVRKKWKSRKQKEQ